eukprot:2323348-Ditylum_brightwellii.AAC.2
MAAAAYTTILKDHPHLDDDSLNHPPTDIICNDGPFYENYKEYVDYNDNGYLNYPPALVPATPFFFSCYAYTADILCRSHSACDAIAGSGHSALLSLPF